MPGALRAAHGNRGSAVIPRSPGEDDGPAAGPRPRAPVVRHFPSRVPALYRSPIVVARTGRTSESARIINRMTRRQLGYVVWGSAFVVTIVPELLASINAVEKHLPFPTISRTIGHLEVVNPVWEIFPTALIVLFVYALL